MGTSIRFLLLSTLLTSTYLAALAQNVPFTPEKFPYKGGLKAAQKALKNGEDLYTDTPPKYAAALVPFQEAQKFNPNNAALNMRIGDCYLNLGDKAQALTHLQKAADLESGPAPRTHFLLGRALQLNAKWSEAIREYERAKPVAVAASTPKKGQPADASAAELSRRMAECKNGLRLMQHPVRVFIDNLGPGLNSTEADHTPLVNADESMLYFSTRRGGKGAGEDVYQAVREGANWGTARNPNVPINSSGDDEAVAISADGQRLLLHASNTPDDLSESHLTAAGWSKPKELGSHINSKSRETSATFSADGKYVYFVSDKPEGSLGGRDVYRAEIEGKNPPQNLGSAINTPYDEEGVYLHPDGKTLYFSSQGHGTMGGFDVFKSVYENGKWSEPENLGWPINTPDDDLFFVVTASGRYGYYASDRPGGLGGKDIYRVTFLGPEKQPLLSQQDRLLSAHQRPVKAPVPALKVPVVTPNVTVLKGTIINVASRQPVQAQLEVVDNATGLLVATFQSTAKGNYLVNLPSGKNYGLIARHENYLFHSENLNLPPAANFAETVKDIRLQKMEPGSNIVLNNIFFEAGKATLRPESTAELDRLCKLLAEAPKLKLQLCGHTDNVGNADANQELSQRRAEAVAAYLTQHKIKSDRVTATGFGSAIPIASNTTEAGRQLNQRLAFKVVSK